MCEPAAALGALVRQIDISEYRDRLGHDLKNSTAFLHAQAIVVEFGVTHQDICRVLEVCGEDVDDAARRLHAIGRGEARPSDRPPEYRTWTMGP